MSQLIRLMLSPVCGTQSLEPVDFDFCNPNLSQSEIRRIFISNTSSDPFEDWTVAPEWIARISPNSNDRNAIRALMVIGDKPTPTSQVAELSMGRRRKIRKNHVVNFTIDDVTEANHAFIQDLGLGRNFRVWYETTGGYMFGGNEGIICYLHADMVLRRGQGEIMTYDGSLEWSNLRTEDRTLSPIFNDVSGGCSEVDSLTISEIGISSFMASWEGDATFYQYAYNETGEEPTEWTLISANTVTIHGLDSDTEYYFFVRAICDNGAISGIVSDVVTTEVPPVSMELMEATSYPFAVYGFRFYTTDVAGVVCDDSDEYDDYVDYLNGLGFEGTFARVSNVLTYTTEGDLPPMPTVSVIYAYTKITFDVDSVGAQNGIYIQGITGYSPHVIDWGDGSVPDSVNASGVRVVRHTFISDGADIIFRVFHGNRMTSLYCDEGGAIYPVSNAFVTGLYATPSTALIGIDFVDCQRFTNATSQDLSVSLAGLSQLRRLRIDRCPIEVVNVSLRTSLPQLNTLLVRGCPLTSEEVDLIFITITESTWNGTSVISVNTKCDPPESPAPPTPASAASRLLITAAGGSITTD